MQLIGKGTGFKSNKNNQGEDSTILYTDGQIDIIFKSRNIYYCICIDVIYQHLKCL